MPKAAVAVAFALLALLALTTSLSAQTDVSWLIGTWDGKQRVSPTEPGTVTVVIFREEGGGIKWDLAVTSAEGFTSEARGDAVVTGSSVQMKGVYHGGRSAGPLSYALTREGDELRGTGVGSTNRVFDTMMKRRK